MPRKCKRKSETHACEKEEKQRITRRAASMVGEGQVVALGEISMQNQMRNAASRVIVVADSSKFGRASLVRICPIHAVEAIITDGGVDPEQAAAVENCGVRLILV